MVRVTWHHCLLVDRRRQRLASDPERLLQQRRVAGGQRVEADEVRRGLLGEHLDAAGSAGWMRWLSDSQSSRVRPPISRGTTTSPSSTQRGAISSRSASSSSGKYRPEVLAAAGLQHHVVAVAEHQRAEAVPLRFVGPHPGLVGHLGLRPWRASAPSAAARGGPRFPYSCRPRTRGNVIGPREVREKVSDRAGVAALTYVDVTHTRHAAEAGDRDAMVELGMLSTDIAAARPRCGTALVRASRRRQGGPTPCTCSGCFCESVAAARSSIWHVIGLSAPPTSGTALR